MKANQRKRVSSSSEVDADFEPWRLRAVVSGLEPEAWRFSVKTPHGFQLCVDVLVEEGDTRLPPSNKVLAAAGAFVERIKSIEEVAIGELLRMYKQERDAAVSGRSVVGSHRRWRDLQSIGEIVALCRKRVGVHWLVDWPAGTFTWSWSVKWDVMYSGRSVHFVSWTPA
jgi:hypothetical protein